LNKDSHNSNKPPSTDDPYKNTIKNNREKSGKKPGGQFGHKGNTLRKVENPDKVILHSVFRCIQCEADLTQTKLDDYETRQVFDTPKITRIVTEHRAEIRNCPCCGFKNKAEFPVNVINHTQYGENIKTHILYLKNHALVPFEKLSEIFFEIMGIKISQGTIENFQKEISKSLIDYELKQKENILKAPVINVDETGYMVKGELNWLHLAATELLTLYFPHIKRGSEGIRAMGILDKYTGICIHDGWKSYYDFLCRHGLCNVHHLRELLFLYEEMNQDWAWDMGGLLKRIKIAKEDRFPIDIINKREFEKEYNEIIERGYLENPIPKKIHGKRGRQKKGKVICLLDRLREYKDQVLLFMNEKDVPFSNNLAERDIRMMKVQQKISGAFRSESGAENFCRIRGFISTIRKKGQNIYQALVNSLYGNAIIYAAE
jgi:transposase